MQMRIYTPLLTLLMIIDFSSPLFDGGVCLTIRQDRGNINSGIYISEGITAEDLTLDQILAYPRKPLPKSIKTFGWVQVFVSEKDERDDLSVILDTVETVRREHLSELSKNCIVFGGDIQGVAFTVYRISGNSTNQKSQITLGTVLTSDQLFFAPREELARNLRMHKQPIVSKHGKRKFIFLEEFIKSNKK